MSKRKSGRRASRKAKRAAACGRIPEQLTSTAGSSPGKPSSTAREHAQDAVTHTPDRLAQRGVECEFCALFDETAALLEPRAPLS